MLSPYSSRAFRYAARAAALRRISAKEEERTPERIEEELSAARDRVKTLERELADARKAKEPEEESAAARLSLGRIYGRMNARKGGRHDH